MQTHPKLLPKKARMTLQNEILKVVELGVQNKHPKFTVSSGGSEGGRCAHRKFGRKNKTIEMTVPTDTNDLGRVIRWHELMHAKHSANNPHCGSIGGNAGEDILIHLAGLEIPSFDAKFRHLYRSMVKVGIGDINGNISPSLRSSNPIRRLLLENTGHAPFYRSVFLRGLSLLMLVAWVGRKPESSAYTLVKTEDCGLRTLAIKIIKRVTKQSDQGDDLSSTQLWDFWAGFESNLHAQGLSISQYDAFANSKYTYRPDWRNQPMMCFMTQIVALAKRISLAAERRKTKETRKHHRLLLALVKAFVDNPAKEMVMEPHKNIPKGMLGSSTNRMVRYVENDLTHRCCTSVKPYASPSSTGSGINPSRLTKAVFGYPSVFTRRKQVNKPPSAIMLDMSSSMSWSREQLAEMCAILPSADVFIYSNKNHRGAACDGTIERIASKGRRVGEMPRTGGGNGCDLQAMEKLLSFKGNVVLVSDLGFCGQGSAAEALALDLVYRNVGKRLTVCDSSHKAIKFFKERSKKGW